MFTENSTGVDVSAEVVCSEVAPVANATSEVPAIYIRGSRTS